MIGQLTAFLQCQILQGQMFAQMFDRCLPRCMDARCLDARCLDARCLDVRCLDARCLDARCLDARCSDARCPSSLSFNDSQICCPPQLEVPQLEGQQLEGPQLEETWPVCQSGVSSLESSTSGRDTQNSHLYIGKRDCAAQRRSGHGGSGGSSRVPLYNLQAANPKPA
jgi:hypothetical protein